MAELNKEFWIRELPDDFLNDRVNERIAEREMKLYTAKKIRNLFREKNAS